MNKFPNIRKIQDILKPLLNLLLRKSQHRPIQVHILKPRILHIKARPQLQKRRDPPLDLHLSARSAQDPRNNLQDRRLPGTIHPDDPHRLSLPDRHTHIPQGIMLLITLLPCQPQRVLQPVPIAPVQLIHLRNILQPNRFTTHTQVLSSSLLTAHPQNAP